MKEPKVALSPYGEAMRRKKIYEVVVSSIFNYFLSSPLPR